MRINNPPILDHIIEKNAITMRCKKINIGVWDMDGSSSISRTHGLTITKIVNISVVLFEDSETELVPLDTSNNTTSPQGWWVVATTTIWLERLAGGRFNDFAYSSTGINRGFIFIWYME